MEFREEKSVDLVLAVPKSERTWFVVPALVSSFVFALMAVAAVVTGAFT